MHFIHIITCIKNFIRLFCGNYDFTINTLKKYFFKQCTKKS